jgi:hypothetical protein
MRIDLVSIVVLLSLHTMSPGIILHRAGRSQITYLQYMKLDIRCLSGIFDLFPSALKALFTFLIITECCINN